MVCVLWCWIVPLDITFPYINLGWWAVLARKIFCLLYFHNKFCLYSHVVLLLFLISMLLFDVGTRFLKLFSNVLLFINILVWIFVFFLVCFLFMTPCISEFGVLLIFQRSLKTWMHLLVTLNIKSRIWNNQNLLEDISSCFLANFIGLKRGLVNYWAFLFSFLLWPAFSFYITKNSIINITGIISTSLVQLACHCNILNIVNSWVSSGKHFTVIFGYD